MTTLADLLGESEPAQALRAEVARVVAITKDARRLPSILIQGETGTGKGLVAQVLHRAGTRTGGPFISVNCAAIPEALLEAELFGYEPGAFTDAKRRKAGLFQMAHGGVLFLDEVALLSEALQAKLLTAIEDRKIRRLGATTSEPIDVWVVTATNADLGEAVRARTFREDLYHRLAVVCLRLPPLRNRGGDVLLLARHFLTRLCAEYGLPPRHFLPDAEARLLAHAWPGNVRELMNVVERATLMATDLGIGASVLGLGVRDHRPEVSPPRGEKGLRDGLLTALEETGWNITQTAAKLQLSRNTVRARIARFNLRRESADVPAGTALAAPIVPSTSTEPAPSTGGTPLPGRLVDWERRRVVFLRALLKATEEPTPLSMAEELEATVGKILSFGGRIEGIRPDSVHASFGVVAVDDAARRAVNAALAIQRLFGQSRGEPSPRLSAALVLHTAQLMVARVADAIQIDERQRAEAEAVVDEMIARASAGSILVTTELAPFLGRHFELAPESGAGRPAGPSYRVVKHDASGVGAWRRLSPFTGRDHELSLLDQRWDQARQGRGQLVNIAGDPGVGKSRLLWEFCQHHVAPARVLSAAVTPIDTASPYQAVGELVRALFGPSIGEESGALRGRITALMRSLEVDPSSVMAPILELLGRPTPEWVNLDPALRKKQISSAVIQVLTELSARSPLVVVVEDAQWLDPDSLAIVATIVDTLARLPLLFVIAHRPEFHPPWPYRAHCTELRLAPLSDESARKLLDALLGKHESVEALKPLMTSWTGGNPLFVEESVRTLAESGVLSGDTAEYRLEGPVSKLEAPPTVEGVLEERIDRLAPIDKTVLQAMAVAGVEVELGILAKLVTVDWDVLRQSLARLHAAEFVYLSHVSPERTFAFKHGLTREVAYQMLPPERRRLLHAAVLSVGEGLYADHADERADWLAHHAVQGEVWSRAVTHLRRAAGRAIARASHRVAAQHLEAALAVLDHLPPSEDRTRLAFDLRIDLRHAVTPLGLVQHTLEHLRAAEALAIELDDPAKLGRVVSFIANCLVLQGRYGEALVTGERALRLARELDDRPLQIASQVYLARARQSRGEYGTAVELFQQIIRSLDERPIDHFADNPVRAAVFARSSLASTLAELGDFAGAQAHADEATRRAEASGHPDSVVAAYWGAGLVALMRGHAEEAAGVFDRLLTLCRTHDLDAYISRSLAGLGCARARLGQVAEGRSLLEQAVALDAAAEPRTTHTLTRAALAEACLMGEDLGRASTIALEARQQARVYEERAVEAYATWVLATAQSLADDELAGDTFQAAAAIATELRLQPLLAHCWRGLAKLHERRGQDAGASEYRERERSLLERLGVRPWDA